MGEVTKMEAVRSVRTLFCGGPMLGTVRKQA